MMKNKTQKGFTLIELLMVVALIAILSTMILVMLDTGREKAEVNRYVSYATQMFRLVASSVAAGQFDVGGTTIVDDAQMCLGDVGYTCGGNVPAPESNDPIYKALTYLTEMPETDVDNSKSPYSSTHGVWMDYDTTDREITVFMYLLNDDVHLPKVCNSMGWGTDLNSNTCYATVPLHSRL